MVGRFSGSAAFLYVDSVSVDCYRAGELPVERTCGYSHDISGGNSGFVSSAGFITAAWIVTAAGRAIVPYYRAALRHLRSVALIVDELASYNYLATQFYLVGRSEFGAVEPVAAEYAEACLAHRVTDCIGGVAVLCAHFLYGDNRTFHIHVLVARDVGCECFRCLTGRCAVVGVSFRACACRNLGRVIGLATAAGLTIVRYYRTALGHLRCVALEVDELAADYHVSAFFELVLGSEFGAVETETTVDAECRAAFGLADIICGVAELRAQLFD